MVLAVHQSTYSMLKAKGLYVNVQSKVGADIFHLILNDVLYVSANRHNLLLLGRWDDAGGKYQGGNSVLTLTTKQGKTVATGIKLKNNLYT